MKDPLRAEGVEGGLKVVDPQKPTETTVSWEEIVRWIKARIRRVHTGKEAVH